MIEDHIAVKIDGVLYVKFDDVKPMRDRIEKLTAALREIADASSTFGVATYANYYAIAKRALHEPMSEPEARIAINKARKVLEGKE